MSRPTTSSLPLTTDQPNKDGSARGVTVEVSDYRNAQAKEEIGEFTIEKVRTEPPVQEREVSDVRFALERGASVETVERLVALQEKMLARKAETDFNEALSRVQAKIARIAPDLTNSQTSSKYASYAAIDRVIRPLYSAEGFSLSFTHAECPKPEFIRVICWVRHGAHKEPYQVDWPVSTTGPKGGALMTPTQATGASDSYAKRYLVKDIFNVAIGEDDNDGNGAVSIPEAEVEKACKEISEAKTDESMRFLFRALYEKSRELGDVKAGRRAYGAKEKRKKELRELANAPR